MPSVAISFCGNLYWKSTWLAQAVAIDPFNITNLYINYTLKSLSKFSQTRIKLTFNNLFDKHSIVGVTPASTATSVAAPGDILTLLPGRSFMITFTPGYAPNR